MEQDGKVDQPATAQSSPDSSTGKIMLTLFMPSGDVSGYRHAIIPFPPTYEVACAEGLKTFAAYIPTDVETVSLRQAVQRRYAQAVWSIIREDSWDTILEKSGEELGVFLPDVLPESIPYQQPLKKLVRFQYFDSSFNRALQVVVKAIGSLTDCVAFQDILCRQKGLTGYKLFYDERMLGTEAEQQFYRNNVQNSNSKPTWRVLSVNDPEMFNLLLERHPEPMTIHIASVNKIRR